MHQSQQQQQQQQQGQQDCPHGPGAYNLGLVMGQHVDIIILAIYRRHRIYRAFPGPTAVLPFYSLQQVTQLTAQHCRCCYTVNRKYEA